jgi:hypothetical protein
MFRQSVTKPTFGWRSPSSYIDAQSRIVGRFNPLVGVVQSGSVPSPVYGWMGGQPSTAPLAVARSNSRFGGGTAVSAAASGMTMQQQAVLRQMQTRRRSIGPRSFVSARTQGQTHLVHMRPPPHYPGFIPQATPPRAVVNPAFSAYPSPQQAGVQLDRAAWIPNPTTQRRMSTSPRGGSAAQRSFTPTRL